MASGDAESGGRAQMIAGTMLQRLTDQIAECLARATAAERLAEKATDADLKADYLATAKQWVYLAKSFLLDAENHKHQQPPEPPTRK